MKFPLQLTLSALLLVAGSITRPLCSSASAATGEADSTRPNILLIYADDLGYGDVQCYNPTRGKILTPNIDRLASEGLRFTDAHSSSAVCSPSRYTLLTGRYHWRTRLQSGIVGLWGPPVITTDRITIGRLAQQHGYHTACIGKWHLGWNWPIDPADKEHFLTGGYGGKKNITATPEHRAAWKKTFSQAIPGGPTAVGFDEYFGTDVPNWPPYCFIENDRTQGLPTEFASADLFRHRNLASVQGPALADWKLEPILPALGNRAVEFLNRTTKDTKPFLLYMPLTSPHTPLSVNDAWKGKSKLARDGSSSGDYADFVMETDAVIGQVLTALEQSGAAENTLVIFTSDNGCAPYIGVTELEEQGHFPSGPLRGYKADVWEGGHRVPFIVRWPGEVEPNTRSDHLIHQADVLATLAAIFETPLPSNAGEDSFSLLPLIRGGDQAVRTHAVSCSSQGLPSIRSGDWKYIPGPGSGGWAKGATEQPIQLFNMADDIGETNNLAADQPDRVRDMSAQLENLISRGRSTPGTAQENDVEVRRYPRKAAKE